MNGIDPAQVQWDDPSPLVGMPANGMKYSPAQMQQLNAARDALRAAESTGVYGVGGTGGIDPSKVQWDQPGQVLSDPTDGMSTLDKLRAGFGKALYDTARGVGQLTGFVSQQDIDQAKKLDAPLMRTGAGLAGDVLGNVASFALPAGAIGIAGKAAGVPALVNAARAFMAPQSVLGAMGTGAAMGAVQPVASSDSRLLNAGLGAAGGGAAAGAGAVLGLGANAIAPFTGSGRGDIVGRALQRFASSPDTIANANVTQLVPGSLPTLAEATADPGLAQLQRTLANNPDIGPALASRAVDNNAARLDALRTIAGDEGQMDFYKASRDQAANDLYSQAFGEVPTATPWIKGQITQLSKRPAFQQAFQQAKDIALNEGLTLDSSNVVQVAHYTKLALDDMIGSSSGNAQRAMIDTRNKLVSLLQSKDFSPSYGEARATFAEMSKPINQMEVGQYLVNKLQPALGQFGASSRSTANAYAQAVRDANTTAQRATGFGGAKLDNILTPEQLGLVNNVASDLGRAANAQDLGRAVGSNTAQNLISQDMLGQTLGSLGVMPKAFASSSLAQTLMRPVAWAYKIPEQKVMGLLGDAMLDPELAKLLVGRSGPGILATGSRALMIPGSAAGLLSLPALAQ